MPRLKDQDKIKQREKQAYDFFISRGRSPEQSAGIVGNLVWESNLRTDAVGDGRKAYGIAQWHPDRQSKFKSVYGKDIRQASFEEQLEFVDWELNNTEKRAGEMLLSVATPEDAGRVISDYYERPQKKYHQNLGRRQAVSTIYSTYANPGYALTDTASIKEIGDSVRQTMSEIPSDKSLPQVNYESTGMGGVATAEVEPQQETEQTDIHRQSIQRKIDIYNFVQDSFRQQEAELAAFHNQQPQIQQPQEPLINPYAAFLSQPPQQFKDGGQIPVSPNGVYEYPQQQVLVPTSGDITMKNVPYPILGTSMETGQKILMQPNGEYYFPQTQFVLEQPL